MALVLFLVTVVINGLAKLLIMSVAGRANASKHT